MAASGQALPSPDETADSTAPAKPVTDPPRVEVSITGVAHEPGLHRCYHLHRGLNWVVRRKARFGSPDRGKWLVTVASVLATVLIGTVKSAGSSVPDPIAATAKVAVTAAGGRAPKTLTAEAEQWIAARKFVLSAVIYSLQGAIVGGVSCMWLLSPIHPAKAKRLLDHAADNFFRSPNRKVFTYRATLFKIRGGWWTFGRWLGIAARSGDCYTESNTIFGYHRTVPTRSTGYFWVCQHGMGITVETKELLGLPEAYITTCRLDPREARRLTRPPQYLSITMVRRGGKPWGYLVLDSDDPSQCPPKRETRDSESVRTNAIAGVVAGLENLLD